MLALQCEDIVPLALLLCQKGQESADANTPNLQTTLYWGSMIDPLITNTAVPTFFSVQPYHTDLFKLFKIG